MLFTRMWSYLSARLHSDEGATMVEYGIMVALIAVVSILIITSIGNKLLGAFTSVDGALP